MNEGDDAPTETTVIGRTFQIGRFAVTPNGQLMANGKFAPVANVQWEESGGTMETVYFYQGLFGTVESAARSAVDQVRRDERLGR